MSFTITITRPTGEEAIAELIRVADFYRARPELQGQGGYFNMLFEAEAASKPAPAPKATKAKPAPAPAPVVAEPAPVVAESAPAPAAPAVTSEQVRAFLAPFLRDADNVAKVQALLKEFDAPRLSSIPSEKLGDFLTKAQEVFA
jgi:biotin carboxyl carrier protein